MRKVNGVEARSRKLERIFDQTITYQVPLFQRPYVWTEEAHWQPLWDDVQSLLDKHLRGERVHPHFLGAVVLEQVANQTCSIESRQIIDGQQRFTTLQLFLIAARDAAAARNEAKFVERFNDLVSNRRSKIDHDDEVFKVWPTNSNRVAFRAVHEAGSRANLEKVVRQTPQLQDGVNNIVSGYQYFDEQVSAWIKGELDDNPESLANKSTEDRFEALWNAVKESLQLVVIDLDPNDETQVIFETLNARGEELLPADLIKNFLFRRAATDGEDVEKLYVDHWQKFETSWWREKVKQGRITRRRVDVFINYYLAMMTREEVKSTHLFNAFKGFIEDSACREVRSHYVPVTAAEQITKLSRYADVFKAFDNPVHHPRLTYFLRRLAAVDTTTVYPFLLYAYGELVPDNLSELDKILVLVESYLMRRMICGLTGKNYNRYFVDLIKAVDSPSGVNAKVLAMVMAKSDAESTRYPNDHALLTALENLPLYGRLAQYKVRAVLEALDLLAQTPKSEVIPLPSDLTIEHVMPQTWQAFWPLPLDAVTDPATGKPDLIEVQKLSQRREQLLNTLGNLTLITGSLNPSLSNSSWEKKRPELLKFNKLNLTQYFHGEDAVIWNENAIEKRSQHLMKQILVIWPDVASAVVAS